MFIPWVIPPILDRWRKHLFCILRVFTKLPLKLRQYTIIPSYIDRYVNIRSDLSVVICIEFASLCPGLFFLSNYNVSFSTSSSSSSIKYRNIAGMTEFKFLPSHHSKKNVISSIPVSSASVRNLCTNNAISACRYYQVLLPKLYRVKV